jgi:biopolymer transport protein ExbD
VLNFQHIAPKLRAASGVQSGMAMTTGNKAEINVTPMIDVLLVLLIIMMVILPQKSNGLDASVPQPPVDSDQPPPPPREIVVSVHKDRTLDINTESVTWPGLADRLKQILARRPDGIVYVAGAPSLEFQDVARVLDEAREAGINRVALMPRIK